MPSMDLHALARVLGALLPQRTRSPLLQAPSTAHALADSLAAACLNAGLASRDARRIADSITRYLVGGERGEDTYNARIGKGTAILQLEGDAPGEEVVLVVPHGLRLTDEALTQLLHWALLETPAAEDEPRQRGEP
jgi:hypothetical protein